MWLASVQRMCELRTLIRMPSSVISFSASETSASVKVVNTLGWSPLRHAQYAARKPYSR